MAKYLVERGADINKENEYGETPLFEACENGKLVIVKYLIEHGADINKRNNTGETPLYKLRKLYYARKNEEVEKYLVEHGAVLS